MPDQFEPTERFWEKTAAEQAHIWQNRFTIALVVAVVGWVIVLACFFCAISGDIQTDFPTQPTTKQTNN